MRATDKNSLSHSGYQQLDGMDFHDVIQKEQQTSLFEMTSEFGISHQDTKKLRKHLNRF